MKILTTILTCSSTQERANACLATWIKDIKSPHDYFFYGDKIQSQTMGKTWNCSPDEGEHRHRLPKKTYKMLVESLNHDWDFLLKCDDDTYVNFNKLVELLEDYDANNDLYLGRKIINPFAYAQGGAGYVLSRSVVHKCINASEIFLTSPISEDRTLGTALKSQGVNLIPTDLLTTTEAQKAKQDQEVCIDAIIKNGKVTTHYVNPQTMQKIHHHLHLSNK